MRKQIKDSIPCDKIITCHDKIRCTSEKVLSPLRKSTDHNSQCPKAIGSPNPWPWTTWCSWTIQVSTCCLYMPNLCPRPEEPPIMVDITAPMHPTCTYRVPKWPDNAYGDKHPVEQVKEIKHTKCWCDIIWEPGPSRQIPDEPASQMPGDFPNTSVPPALTPTSAESDSEADVEQLCHEGGAGLAIFLMSKIISYKADSTESKPLHEWTYKDIQMLPAAAQEEWKATC